MAQATMTVRTDAALKATFDKLCTEFGMSANTAMNIFMRAVAETRSIPFRIGKKEESIDERLNRLLIENRQERLRTNAPDFTLDEINAEISACRTERKKHNEENIR